MKPENNPIKRALLKPTHLNAIKAMCAHCMGCTLEDLQEGFREDIRNCTAPACPLFPFRPYRANNGAAKRQESTLPPGPYQPIGEAAKRAGNSLAVGFQGVRNG